MRSLVYLLWSLMALAPEISCFADDSRLESRWQSNSTSFTWDTASGDTSFSSGEGEDKKALQASGLAWHRKSNSLYLLSEDRRALLVFPAGEFDSDTYGSKCHPTLIELNLYSKSGQPVEGTVDLEAIAIHRDFIYLCDEDSLSIYQFRISVPPPGRNGGKVRWTNNRQITLDPGVVINREGHYSIEGMVVVDRPLHDPLRNAGKKLWFYLLDEQDKVENPTSGRTEYEAVIRTTFLEETSDTLKTEHKAVRIPLGDSPSRRLTELVYIPDQGLAAIYSVFGPDVNASYALLSLSLTETDQSLLDDMFLLPVLEKTSSKYEGAAISTNGDLFVVTDNLTLNLLTGKYEARKTFLARYRLNNRSGITRRAKRSGLYRRFRENSESGQSMFWVKLVPDNSAAGENRNALTINQHHVSDASQPVPVLLNGNKATCRLSASGHTRRFMAEPFWEYTWFLPPATNDAKRRNRNSCSCEGMTFLAECKAAAAVEATIDCDRSDCAPDDTNADDAGTGNTGTGNAEAGEAGTGDTEAGEAGTGDASAGNADASDAGTGDTDAGEAEAGEAGAGDTSAGGANAGDTTGSEGADAAENADTNNDENRHGT